LNLRPLGYEHPNRRLDRLPRSPQSLPITGDLPIGDSVVSTRADAPRHVLVTGLVTGADPSKAHPTLAMTVLRSTRTAIHPRAVTFHV
jgi:hypothetical protein